MMFMDFPGARYLGAPADWDQKLDGAVGVLPVADSIDTQSGMPWMHSVWKPSEDEVALLAAGGAIRLGIMGRGHPVVNMAVLTPEVAMTCDEVSAGDEQR